MDQELLKRIEVLEAKVDRVYESSEKMRKYFLTLIIVTVILFVLPLLAIIPMINSVMDTYSAIGELGI